MNVTTVALYFYWEYKGNIYLVDLKKDYQYKIAL